MFTTIDSYQNQIYHLRISIGQKLKSVKPLALYLVFHFLNKRIFDPYNNLSNQQIKNKAWKYIKESSRVEVKRNI